MKTFILSLFLCVGTFTSFCQAKFLTTYVSYAFSVEKDDSLKWGEWLELRILIDFDSTELVINNTTIEHYRFLTTAVVADSEETSSLSFATLNLNEDIVFIEFVYWKEDDIYQVYVNSDEYCIVYQLEVFD